MVPIKIKITLLALVSILFLGIAIIHEYQSIQKKLADAEKTLAVVNDISFLSELIHHLQKERGLTATLLVSNRKDIQDRLIRQYLFTDRHLSKALEIVYFRDDKHLLNFTKKLKNLREKVSNNTTTWKMIKGFYSTEIEQLLTHISLDLAEVHHFKEITHQLNAVVHLAMARENLGLLRANISRYYQRGSLTNKELLDTSGNYGGFIAKLKEFRSHVKKLKWNDWEPHIESDVLVSVKKQIISIMQGNTVQEPIDYQNDTLLWWREATILINSMKEVESTLLKKIKNYSQRVISDSQQNISTYSFIALFIFVLISVLTASSVIRILRALSILINLLSRVEETQNFSLRIQGQAKDEFGQLSFSINRLLDYTDQIIQEKDRLASTDLLTGVMNRRNFTKISEREILRSQRYDTQLSILFFDIDHFKSINDKYGHGTGDEVLKIFAKTIQDNIRNSDRLARWGGEEFVLIAPETKETQAHLLAENLRHIVEELNITPAGKITCSIGVAVWNKGETFEQFCERADNAMYKAKSLGRNQVCVASGFSLY